MALSASVIRKLNKRNKEQKKKEEQMERSRGKAQGGLRATPIQIRSTTPLTTDASRKSSLSPNIIGNRSVAKRKHVSGNNTSYKPSPAKPVKKVNPHSRIPRKGSGVNFVKNKMVLAPHRNPTNKRVKR
tara:strand:+ start:348 stop:734 length:387 start_codon:yes stop_codon:yes gene_type:complete